MLLSSFAEEFKNFIQRLYINPQTMTIKVVLHRNSYDTYNQMTEELHLHIQNYKKIIQSLENFPEWKLKVKGDIDKLVAYANIKEAFPEYYDILVLNNFN